MSKRFWKIFAIAEFILITLGVVALYMRILMPTSVKDVILILANVFMLIGFLAGSTGWLMIIALICDKREKKGADHG